MITYNRKHINVAECWYTPVENTGSADLVQYRQLTQRLDDGPAEEFHTIWIDLSKSEAELLADMNESTRRHLRQAQKLVEVVYEPLFPPRADAVRDFFDFYNRFAAGKGLEPLSMPSLEQYQANGCLDLSRMLDSDGSVLVWHSHYREGQYARLLHSASLFREGSPETAKKTGQANRLQHWLDMLRFRGEGISTYDFGGWYHGTEDEARLRINQFKEGFGGRRIVNYHCTRPVTMKGRLFLFATRLRKQIKSLRNG